MQDLFMWAYALLLVAAAVTYWRYRKATDDVIAHLKDMVRWERSTALQNYRNTADLIDSGRHGDARAVLRLLAYGLEHGSEEIEQQP